MPDRCSAAIVPVKASMGFINNETFSILVACGALMEGDVSAKTQTRFSFIDSCCEYSIKHRVNPETSLLCCNLDESIIVGRDYLNASCWP